MSQLHDASSGTEEESAPGSSDLKPEDYYFDGAHLVFTEAYHRKRGYCCNSGCRHCPWREGVDCPSHSCAS